MQNFPAITLKQPWATLVARGIKDVENRTWAPDGDYRGPVYIHAGQKWDDCPLPVELWMPKRELFTFGAIIGTAEIVNVVEDSRSPWAVPGHKHWILTNAETLIEPIPWRGRLGLWWPVRDLKTPTGIH